MNWKERDGEKAKGRERWKESILTLLQAYRLNSDSLSHSPSDSLQSHETLKPIKRDYFKTILYIQLETVSISLGKDPAIRESLPMSYRLYRAHSLSISALYNLHLISISKIISLWVMHCRRSGEFVITWLWNQGSSACKTHSSFFRPSCHSLQINKANLGADVRNEHCKWEC